MQLEDAGMTGLGCLLGIAHSRWNLDAAQLVAFAREVEESGIASVWIFEDFFEGEAVAQAAAILTHTERVRVGIAVTNPWVRHPALLAMSAATLARLGPGRFRLGLGRSLPDWMRPMGVKRRPVEHVAQCADVLRRLLRGDTVTGEVAGFILDGVRLAEAPAYQPPIYISAMGPKMLAVAGAWADGVLIDTFVTPEWISEALTLVRSAADAAGRAHPVVTALVATGGEEQRPAIKDWMREWLSIPRWGETRLLWGAPPGASRDNLPAAFVDRAAAIGSPETIAQRFRGFAAVGVDEIFVSTRERGDELATARRVLATISVSPG